MGRTWPNVDAMAVVQPGYYWSERLRKLARLQVGEKLPRHVGGWELIAKEGEATSSQVARRLFNRYPRMKGARLFTYTTTSPLAPPPADKATGPPRRVLRYAGGDQRSSRSCRAFSRISHRGWTTFERRPAPGVRFRRVPRTPGIPPRSRRPTPPSKGVFHALTVLHAPAPPARARSAAAASRRPAASPTCGQSKRAACSGGSARRGGRLPRGGGEGDCPLLLPDGGCSVYEDRPFGCRTYFCGDATLPAGPPAAGSRWAGEAAAHRLGVPRRIGARAADDVRRAGLRSRRSRPQR